MLFSLIQHTVPWVHCRVWLSVFPMPFHLSSRWEAIPTEHWSKGGRGICAINVLKRVCFLSIGCANSYWKQYKASSLLFEEALKQTFEHAYTEATTTGNSGLQGYGIDNGFFGPEYKELNSSGSLKVVSHRNVANPVVCLKVSHTEKLWDAVWFKALQVSYGLAASGLCLHTVLRFCSNKFFWSFRHSCKATAKVVVYFP